MSESSSDTILSAQALDKNVRLQAAARVIYARAKRTTAIDLIVSMGILAAAQIGDYAFTNWVPLIAAFASLWLFGSRLLLDPIARQARKSGASTQDLFDHKVLGTNFQGIAADLPSDEEIFALSEKYDRALIYSWYPIKPNISWPRSVLWCQRANAVWSRRQHSVFAWLLLTLFILVFAEGIVVAILANGTLLSYLVLVGIPSLPLLLTIATLAMRHDWARTERRKVETRINFVLAGHSAASDTVDEIQRELFEIRRRAPQVPDALYRLLRPRYEQELNYAAASLDETSPT